MSAAYSVQCLDLCQVVCTGIPESACIIIAGEQLTSQRATNALSRARDWYFAVEHDVGLQ